MEPPAKNTATARDLPQAMLSAPLSPWLSEDGSSLYNGCPVIAVMNDPKLATARRRIAAPAGISAGPEGATAIFSVSYIPAGDVDLWGEPACEFPEEAKAAFEYAANIWGNILSSNVPITIKACWADLKSSSVLAYSGGQPLHRDFEGATRSHTWYQASLANALNESDLDPDEFDMHITFNRNFDWYVGTDGNTPSTQHDLVTVGLYQICQGLNFFGSIRLSEGVGSWGYDTGDPNIYDVFLQDNSGAELIDLGFYSNGSTELGSALVSNNVWFCGRQAMAANGNQPTQMQGLSTWGSMSHPPRLDYAKLNNTLDQFMVCAISAGEFIHDPGPFAKALLSDLGWTEGAGLNSYVDPSGHCGGSGPCYSTVQTAISAASNGTTIKIMQGNYYENISLDTSKQVFLSAGWNNAFTEQNSNSSINSLTRTRGTIIVKKLIIQR